MLMQTKGCVGWADHIVSTLNDRTWNVFDFADVFENLTVFAQETPVSEIVVFYLGEGERIGRGDGSTVWRLFK